MRRCTSRDGLVHHVFSNSTGIVLTRCSDHAWSWRRPDDPAYHTDPRAVEFADETVPATCMKCVQWFVAT